MPVLTKINTNVIADNAVTAAKIPAGAVDSDIGVGSVTASHIAADAVGSSELANDAVLPANIAYLGDGTGNLSGTITGQQLRLGTTFTLTDTLTVNGDLTLSKVRADGTGQSLTQDSSANRTLTGTGTLRMGHATEKTSISGLTGLINDDVTFPIGHVIQTVAKTEAGRVNSNNEIFGNKSTVEISITPRRATSNILLMANFACSTSSTYAYFDFYKNASDVTETYNLSGMSQGCGQTQVESPWISISLLYLDELAENSITEKTYSITSKSSGDAQTYLGGHWTDADMSIVAMEIAV